MALMLGLWFFVSSSGPAPFFAHVIFVGLPLLGAAGCFMVRRGMILDRRAGTLTDWSGVLFPMKHKTVPLGSPTRVLVRYIAPDSSDGSATYYAELEGAPEPVYLANSGDYDRVRRAAEDAALYLGVPLVDSSQEPPTQEKGRAPGSPADTTSRLEGSTRVVYVPASRGITAFVVAIIMAMWLAGPLYALALARPWVLKAGLAGAWLCVVVGALVWAERNRSVRYWLRASGAGLELESHWSFGRAVRRFARDELRQLDLVRGETNSDWEQAELLVRSATHRVRLGSHVPPAELRQRVQELRAGLDLPPGKAEAASQPGSSRPG